MVVTRDGKVIYTIDNPTPGASMSFVDQNVPCYSTFVYRVYAVLNGVNGAYGSASESFGPTCDWKVIATSTNMSGWKSAYLISYDGAGREIDRFTMTSSNPASYNMPMTLGKVFFAWKAGSESVSITFKIKDASGAVVYEYEGMSGDVPEGVLYEGNNGCGNAAPTQVPGEVTIANVGEDIVLSWENKTDYGMNVYRDGLLCALVHGNEYVDESPVVGGHCYRICYLTDGGESPLSNEVCATAGEGCDAPRNGSYYLQNNGKPVITWEAPEVSDGLSGYWIYRKDGEDGEYNQIKILGANKVEYKETKSLTPGTWYYYRVVAYYRDIECYSAPAKATDSNEYYVKVFYNGPLGINEGVAGKVNLYPNPANDSFTIEAESIQHVMVYNTIGQLVHSQDCEGNSAVVNLSGVDTGIYMVKVVTANGESVQKVSVIR